MFELEILLANLMTPAAAMIVAALICRWIPAARRPKFAPPVIATMACVGLALAFGLRNDFSWWPDDAWQKVTIATWLVLAVALAVFALQGSSNQQDADETQVATERLMVTVAKSLAIATSAGAAAYLIFPRGESWSTMQSQLPGYVLAFGAAVGLAWLGVSGCSSRMAATVGFSLIPVLMATAFLTSLSFLKVTEPLIAIATILGVSGFLQIWLSRSAVIATVIAPMAFAICAFTLHAQAYDYLGLSRGLYACAIFSPAAVALIARLSQVSWNAKSHTRSQTWASVAPVAMAVLSAAAIFVWSYFGSNSE